MNTVAKTYRPVKSASSKPITRKPTTPTGTAAFAPTYADVTARIKFREYIRRMKDERPELPPVDGRAEVGLFDAETRARLDRLMPTKPAPRHERRPDDGRRATRGDVRRLAEKVARAFRQQGVDLDELASAVAALRAGKGVRQ